MDICRINGRTAVPDINEKADRCPVRQGEGDGQEGKEEEIEWMGCFARRLRRRKTSKRTRRGNSNREYESRQSIVNNR